jgi:hypothetical protein
MKDVTRVTLLFVLLCCTASTALSQAATVVSSAPGFTCQGSFGPPGVLSLAASAPFSAVQEFSSVQTLADGTHITRKPMTEKIYRDAEGRTRTERAFCRGRDGTPEAMLIEIRDPAAGYSYILDEQNQIAHRFAIQVPRRIEPGVHTASPANSQPVLSSEALLQQPARPTITTESLGTQTMEGVLVEGKRTTRIIPEGMEGNDRPLTVVSEVWRSPELKFVVFEKTDDPRNGERTTRLTNIELSNPILALFQPPADYKIVDETDHVTLTYTRP